MQDKIWFTYKARIQAHIRLAWLDFHSQTLLVWYAILSAGLSVVAIRYPKVLGEDTDVISAALSIVLLGISMAVANRDFRGRAIAMRQNYLDLQRLHDELKFRGSHNDTDLGRYHSLLGSVENHNEIDDKVFRVRYAHTLTSRKPSRDDAIDAYIHICAKAILTVSLYVAPLFIWCIV